MNQIQLISLNKIPEKFTPCNIITNHDKFSIIYDSVLDYIMQVFVISDYVMPINDELLPYWFNKYDSSNNIRKSITYEMFIDLIHRTKFSNKNSENIHPEIIDWFVVELNNIYLGFIIMDKNYVSFKNLNLIGDFFGKNKLNKLIKFCENVIMNHYPDINLNDIVWNESKNKFELLNNIHLKINVKKSNDLKYLEINKIKHKINTHFNLMRSKL